LVEYYTGPGRDDQVAIDLPKGSYSPVIQARSQAPPSLANESIAVIPFNDTEDPNMKYLIDGLSEGLTSRIARIPKLRVAAWTMVLRLKVSRQDFAGAAKELGVRTVLTLRLVVRGEAYEAHVEWLDPEHKTTSGRRYDRQLTDLYSLEDEIAVDLAERITPS
jgi:adenylate cyclase